MNFALILQYLQSKPYQFKIYDMKKSYKFRKNIKNTNESDQNSMPRGISRVSKDTDQFFDIIQKRNSIPDPSNISNKKYNRNYRRRSTTQQIENNKQQKSTKKKSIKTTVTQNFSKKNQNLKSLEDDIYKAVLFQKSKLDPQKFQSYFDELNKIYSKRLVGYNRKVPLMFLKPYLRYKTDKDLEIAKSEIYDSISKSKEYTQKRLLIQYFTQYGDQFEQKHQRNSKKSKTLCPYVLKQKLKIQQNKLTKEINASNSNNEHKSNVCYLNNFLKIF